MKVYLSEGYMFGLGTPELIIILLIILLLFGGRKLPQLARSLGGSMKELKKGMSDGLEDENNNKKQTTNTRKSEEA